MVRSMQQIVSSEYTGWMNLQYNYRIIEAMGNSCCITISSENNLAWSYDRLELVPFCQ